MARTDLSFRVRVEDAASSNLQKVSKNVDGVTSSLKRMAAQALTIGTAIQVARLADQYRLLQNRLRLVTKGTDELRVVTSELVKISVRSRASFQATADLYARVARSSRQLGLSQQELLDFTETVQKSIRISGSTAQEAAAGVIQFGQALASSRLSGDELRSVLEQMPRLAQAIADGMGVSIGRLRELGERGALSATAVLNALRKAAPEIAAEFDQLKPLVSEAFVVLQSSILASIGVIDEAAAASEQFAERLLDVANNVELMGAAVTGTLAPGEQLSSTFQRIAIFALVASESINVLFQSLKAVGSRQFETAGEFLAAAFAKLSIGDNQEQAREITKAFNERLDEIWNEEDLDEARDRIVLGVTDMMEKIAQVMGEFPKFGPPIVDLTTSGTGELITPEERKLIDAAAKSLSKIQDSLQLTVKAAILARDSVHDYDTALKIVKINSLAVTEEQKKLAIALGETTVFWIDYFKTLKAKNDLTKIGEDLELQAQAFKIAAATGLDYAAALGIAELRALGLAAGNEELAENLIKVQTEFELMKEKLADQQRFMESLATRAAQNIQDAFADFLFDPFEDGVKGMVKSFIDALRHMLAQALAFQILTNIPGLGNFFGGGSKAAFATALAGPPSGSGSSLGRASGGPVIAGMPVLVGERGPELFIPSGGGSIKNNSASKSLRGDATFITNIDARGADPGLIARLPGIMEERDKRLMLRMKTFLETGSGLL